MSVVKPFQGWRPIPSKVIEVASPPYDVLSSDEAREKAQNLPYSFLHVVKPEIDLDPSIDPHEHDQWFWCNIEKALELVDWSDNQTALKLCDRELRSLEK